jgi:hypothetical protein
MLRYIKQILFIIYLLISQYAFTQSVAPVKAWEWRSKINLPSIIDSPNDFEIRLYSFAMRNSEVYVLHSKNSSLTAIGYNLSNSTLKFDTVTQINLLPLSKKLCALLDLEIKGNRIDSVRWEYVDAIEFAITYNYQGRIGIISFEQDAM